MSIRHSYDTAIKHLFRLKCQDIIPHNIRSNIPKSCIHRWKNENPDKYIGTELNKLSNEKLQTLQQFASDKNAQKVFIAYARLLITCRQILVSTGVLQSTLLFHKEKIIQVLHQIKYTISLNKSLKILSIPRSTYQLWFFKSKFPCTSSLFSMCRKRYIHQLLPKEHAKMEELLRDPQYVHWPIISIAHYARRNNLLTVSISTWYNYAKMMGFKRRVIPNPKKYRIGLKAAFPNQYWHADVTLFDTLDGIRHYIYLVSDNFSRKILAWKVDTQLSNVVKLSSFVILKGSKINMIKNILFFLLILFLVKSMQKIALDFSATHFLLEGYIFKTPSSSEYSSEEVVKQLKMLRLFHRVGARLQNLGAGSRTTIDLDIYRNTI
ncbi:MAG TPA: hypothetical protein VLZ75_08340 [Chitinophagales bacterium]|nr:hypothetical protein [Chitinophagales bacterium]